MKKVFALVLAVALVLAFAAPVSAAVGGPITFSEYPVTTVITNQYQADGILFDGDAITLKDPACKMAPCQTRQSSLLHWLMIILMEEISPASSSYRGQPFRIQLHHSHYKLASLMLLGLQLSRGMI